MDREQVWFSVALVARGSACWWVSNPWWLCKEGTMGFQGSEPRLMPALFGEQPVRIMALH